jgi:ABC-2 type transport system permease protein
VTTLPLAAARPPRPGRASLALTFAWRGLLKIKHVPEQLLDVTITPILFLVMFTYLFGGAVSGSTSAYLHYILPGVLVQSVVFTCVYSGVVLNTDMTKGVVDRFRTLPIWRPAPLVGAVLGDGVRYVIAALIVVGLGLVMGFRPDAGAPGVLGGMLVVIGFAYGLAWVFMTFGLILRSPSAVLNGGFLILFPLVFLSNTLVHPDTLPGWLEAFVHANPISHVVTATRGLMDGNATTWQVVRPLLEAAVLTAVFAPLTVRLYRSRS